MDKELLSQALASWLKDFLDKKFGDKYTSIEVIIPDRDLKRLNNESIRSIEGSHAWEFKPDLVAILKGNDTKLVLINRSTSAISLKEIGEMYCYAQLAKPLLAMVISPKAASSEVNGILIDKTMQERVLNYQGSNPILVLGWNESTNTVNLDSVIPLEQKAIFS